MSAVLVVEDEQHLADGLRFNLEAEGYNVETVSDGESALSLLLDQASTLRRHRARRDAARQRWFHRCGRTSRGGPFCAGVDVDGARAPGRRAARF